MIKFSICEKQRCYLLFHSGSTHWFLKMKYVSWHLLDKSANSDFFLRLAAILRYVFSIHDHAGYGIVKNLGSLIYEELIPVNNSTVKKEAFNWKIISL